MTNTDSYIEKDAALERRSQPVTVGEPTEEEAVENILRHSGTDMRPTTRPPSPTRPYGAAVELSARYISDRLSAGQGDRPYGRGGEPRAPRGNAWLPAGMTAELLTDKLAELLEPKRTARRCNAQDFERAAAISCATEERAIPNSLDELKEQWHSWATGMRAGRK